MVEVGEFLGDLLGGEGVCNGQWHGVGAEGEFGHEAFGGCGALDDVDGVADFAAEVLEAADDGGALGDYDGFAAELEG